MLTTTLVQFPTTDIRLEYDDHIMLWQKEGIKDDHHSLDISIIRTATHSFRPISFPTHRMPSLTKVSLFLSLTISGLVQAVPAPAPTTPPNLAERASSCTFSGSDGASSASKSKTSCSTIVLSDVAVPSGTTLDLTDLNDGTSVIFEGTTSFGYEEWDGPLISVSGTDITVTGADGHVIDGDGSRWWDGEGSNGGTTKPKFFYAHDLTSSTWTDVSVTGGETSDDCENAPDDISC